MNSFIATGTYVGEQVTDSGLRFSQINVSQTGKTTTEIPILLVRNRSAGDLLDSIQPGAKVLIEGRLYPNKQDYKMYFVPNKPIQIAGNININRLNLSGTCGWVDEIKREDLHVCTMYCTGPSQQILNHNWQDSLTFKLEAWGDDAKRLRLLCPKGRQLSIEGTLRYNTWNKNDGTEGHSYQVRVRSGLYGFFGQNKKKEEETKSNVTSGTKPFEPVNIHQTAKVVENITTPKVNTEEIPF